MVLGDLSTDFERTNLGECFGIRFRVELTLEERAFTVAEAKAAREAFHTSATTIVTAIVSTDGARIGDGYEAATREIWGDLSEHDYESLPARSDDPGNPAEPSRAKRLAHVIWSAFDASDSGSLNSQTPQAAT